MPIPVFINANSKTGQEEAETAFAELVNADVEIGPRHLTESQEEAERLLRQYVDAQTPLVIVAGGDGALSMAADVLAGSQTALGVLPMGTGNTFARSINMPLELPDAAQAIASGKIIEADVGRVNGRVFLNSVTLGISGDLAGKLDKDAKAKFGLFSWPLQIISVLRGHRSLRLKVLSDDRTFTLRTHQLIISNGRYLAGPIEAAPDASVQDSCLRVFALGGNNWKSLVKSTFLWILRRHDEWRQTRYFTAQKLRVISLQKAIQADVDGELCETTPLELEVQPRALKVLVADDFER